MLLATMLLIFTQDVGPKVVPAAAKPVEKLICRNEFEAYSRIPKRVCGTRAEWEQMYKETQDDLNNSRNDRKVAPNGTRW